MYSKDPKRKPKVEKGEPRSFYYVAGGIALLILGAIFFFYFTLKSTIKIQTERVDLTRDCVKILNNYKNGKLMVILCVKADESLVLVWQNLPKTVTSINIYRTEKGSDTQTLWKTVNVNGVTGSTNVGFEDGGPATYNAEGLNDKGEVIVRSVGTVPTGGSGASLSAPLRTSPPPETPPAPNTGGQTGGQGGGQNPPNSTSSTGNNSDPGTGQPTSTSPNNQSPSTPPPPPPPPPNDTSTIIYYTPSGQVVGTSSIPTTTFWVQHVNEKIEIGWQNIPSSTTKLIISRSKTETSGYEQLFIQQDPITAGNDFIRLEDNTIHVSYYYKMEARTNTSLINTYGPTFLPGL